MYFSKSSFVCSKVLTLTTLQCKQCTMEIAILRLGENWFHHTNAVHIISLILYFRWSILGAAGITENCGLDLKYRKRTGKLWPLHTVSENFICPSFYSPAKVSHLLCITACVLLCSYSNNIIVHSVQLWGCWFSWLKKYKPKRAFCFLKLFVNNLRCIIYCIFALWFLKYYTKVLLGITYL